MPNKLLKKPLKDALNVKRGQNIPKSGLAKSAKAPTKVSPKTKVGQRITKIRKP